VKKNVSVYKDRLAAAVCRI